MSTRTPRAFLGVIVLVLLWLVIGGVFSPLSQKLTSVQKNDNASYLPGSAESTKALELQKKFQRQDVLPAIIVYERPAGITDADKAKAAADSAKLADAHGVVGKPTPPIPSADGKALEVVVTIEAKVFDKIPDDVKAIRTVVKSDVPAGLDVRVTGPGGLVADFAQVFGSIDTNLLLVTAIVVALILLVVYRSLVLWLVPLISAGMAYTLAQGVVYLLAAHAGLTVNGQSQGILTVLVFGAGTDYALLLVRRGRHCLGAARDAHLSPGGAAVRSLAVLAVHPEVRVAVARGERPVGPGVAVGGPAPPLLLGGHGRAAADPGRLLHDPEGRGHLAERLADQEDRGRHRPGGADPALPERLGQPRGDHRQGRQGCRGGCGRQGDAGRCVGGVVHGRSAAREQSLGVRPTAEGRRRAGGDRRSAGRRPRQPGRRRHRRAVARPRAQGPRRQRAGRRGTSANLDVQRASQRDNRVIIPIVLLVILLVLGLLLRAIVAPLLLIATVVLSFAATLGVCSLVFTHIFGFAGADSAFPLFTFIFLVALGIDYNIFLMTRVREETLAHGTRPGILKGLAVTGGVITSAGVVLAATFSVLGILPLVFLTELGFAVAFGVLMDTMLVRSVLVPALSYDLGKRIWWPSKLSHVDTEEAEAQREVAGVG